MSGQEWALARENVLVTVTRLARAPSGHHDAAYRRAVAEYEMHGGRLFFDRDAALSVETERRARERLSLDTEGCFCCRFKRSAA